MVQAFPSEAGSPGDVGKRRAYVLLMMCGVLAAVVRLAQTPTSARMTQIHMVVIITLCLLFLAATASHRLPMRWADLFVFFTVAYALLFPLVAWHLGVAWRDSDRGLLAVLLWAVLLFLLAFVVFGTRGGVVASVATLLVLAALVVPMLRSPAVGDGLPIVQDAAQPMAFLYPATIALLWLLSRRLELLTRVHAKAELLAAEATTDVLTGFANRRHLTDQLDLFIANARRYGHQLSVMFVDLDNLKQVNDTHGHDVGDQVLVELVGRIADTVRCSDVVGRWGGDEFLVIATECDAHEAHQLAQRCRDRIRGSTFGDAGTVTASFGVTTMSGDDDRRTLIHRADLALYAAKNEGRDRVVVVAELDSPGDLAVHPT